MKKQILFSYLLSSIDILVSRRSNQTEILSVYSTDTDHAAIVPKVDGKEEKK